ncbi:hypothetical protein Deipe_0160 [Deinococcus peraridilitoris DSM 19664]|uniref:Uncharacterized protein n=2 Tax=Deinococcus TaxID=1298 RepID=K9ZX45_DEIPD|nr:hypothetical protein [Deinococcus peraridilitoris]AFZ65764.1 hypothetical protein Deipe_0160 [Deinococcus peraridilitoris DSM 19664]
MVNVEIRNEQDGQPFQAGSAASVRFLAEVRAWAERNEFNQIVFWRDGEKLWVQLDDERLNYWMPEHLLERGQKEDVEMQLDYARGAHHRSAAGYQKFDK